MDIPDEENIFPILPLTAAEEGALVERMRSGDETARQRLVEANLRLVLNIAKIYGRSDVRTNLPFEELFETGREGLNRALDRFDPQRGFRLSIYATHWIRQAIGRRIDREEGRSPRPLKDPKLPRHGIKPGSVWDEEIALAILRSVKQGDEMASERLLELFSDLVEQIVRDTHHRIWNRKPLDDLRLAGRAGLLQAVQGFDPEGGYRFSTYATHLIRQSVVARLHKA